MFNNFIRPLRRPWVMALFGLALMTGLTLDDQTPVAVASVPDAQGVAEWTIMLYQDADDETLEQDILIDFNEAEIIGSSDDVNIVAQVDRYEGAFDGMGDWTTTKRFYVTQDNDINEIGSEELDDLGELNMADSETLVDFVTWAAENYPAEKYALIMSDHGAGWPGGWNDPDPGGLGPDRVSVAEIFGVDGLWLMEFDQALETARDQSGIDKFELIGFDACLMSQLEVYSAIAPHGNYSVASQELEPAMGWAYASFLDQLVNDPQMDGSELSQAIVASYIDEDQRIVDDQSRLEFLSAFGSDDVGAAQLAEEMSGDITLSAIDLAEIPAVNAAVDNFAATLLTLNPDIVSEARAYAQAFESVFGEDSPSPYIDLIHFSQLVVELSGDSDVAAVAGDLQSALGQAILAEKHGPNRPGSTGVAIHFPTRDIFGTLDNFGYTIVANRFASDTQWDEFLSAFHSGGGQTLTRPQAEPKPEPEPEVGASLDLTEEDVEILVEDTLILVEEEYSLDEIPQALVDEFGYDEELIQLLVEGGFFEGLAESLGGGSRSRSPAAAGPKPIQISPLTLSAELAAPDSPVTMSADISGNRLAYVFTFIGRFLPREEVLLIEDMDYIVADDTKEVGGVSYPVWPDEEFSVEYTWEPTVFAVSDGTDSVKALFRPQDYDAESPTYTVEGTYTFGQSGDQRYAKMYFRDGVMTDIFGFTSSLTQSVGPPRAIVPQSGDQFTVLERGDDLSLEGDAGFESYVNPSGTLTFGGAPFTLETTPAPSGNYVVGFIAEDLDGNTYEQYEGLFVVNEEAGAVDGFVPYVNEEAGFALLYPETWLVDEDAQEGSINFFSADTGEAVSVFQDSYPDAATPAEANALALQDLVELLEQDGELENLEFLTEQPEDFLLGAFDAGIVDFDFDLGGQSFSASAIASTPVPGTTYLITNLALADEFEQAVTDSFDPMLYSFDILISGVSKEQSGPPLPEFAEILFNDDFSDATSGLFDDEEVAEWGRSYYDTSAEQYVFELTPNAGPIYDYYLFDETLPDDFMVGTLAGYDGAVDNAYGLIFQVIPGDEADELYSFRISGDGFYTVEKTADGELAPIIDWTPSELIDQTAGAPNVLAVEGQAGVYNLYINGFQVNNFTDTDLSGGTFGFIVDNFDEESPVTFTFDDLVVGTPER